MGSEAPCWLQVIPDPKRTFAAAPIASSQLFLRKMLVQKDGLQQELLELAAMRLDKNSLSLFCGVFAIELGVSAGTVSPNDAQTFHHLFERPTTCLHLPLPARTPLPQVQPAAEAGSAGTASGQSATGGRGKTVSVCAAEVWLTSAVLDIAVWLQVQISAYSGLAESLIGAKGAWYTCMMSVCPCVAIPAPFAHLSRFHRMLLVCALAPDRLQTALAWFAQVRTRICMPSGKTHLQGLCGAALAAPHS